MADEYGIFTPEQCERIWKATKGFERLTDVSQDAFVPIADPPIYVRNDSGEVIPPYSIMQVSGTAEDGKNYIKVIKPINTATANTDRFLFSGPREIGIDEFSIAQSGPVYRVKKDATTFVAGIRVGPVNGQWTIGKGSMFSYLGDDAIGTDVVRIDQNESLQLAVATSGVPGRTGTTLGSATVAAKHLTISGANRVIADSGRTYTAYNLAATAVAAGAYILTLRLGDAAIIIWEECLTA